MLPLAGRSLARLVMRTAPAIAHKPTGRAGVTSAEVKKCKGKLIKRLSYPP